MIKNNEHCTGSLKRIMTGDMKGWVYLYDNRSE
jgi:hypothetical protein